MIVNFMDSFQYWIGCYLFMENIYNFVEETERDKFRKVLGQMFTLALIIPIKANRPISRKHAVEADTNL